MRKFPNPKYVPNDPSFHAVVAARKVFEDVFSACTAGSNLKECRIAANRPDLADGDLSVRKGFERVDIKTYCVEDNYAWLKADVHYEDGVYGTVLSSFVRTIDGSWTAPSR